MKTFLLLSLLAAGLAAAAVNDIFGLQQQQSGGGIKPVTLSGVAPGQSIVMNSLGVPVARQLLQMDVAGDVRNFPLSGFTRRYANTALPGMLGISGVTYNPRSGTLFLVRNISGAAGFTYEFSLDGNLLRTITHSNFIDTEGICWVGWDAATASDVFIYTQEDHTVDAALDSSLVIIRMTPAAVALDGSTGVTATTGYGGDGMANLGVEGVAYDPLRGVVYYTAEKRTAAGDQNTPGSVDAKIYTRTVTTTGTFTWGAESVQCDIAPLFSGTLTDVSDMCYDINTDTLLLLSDESDKVVRINRTTGALLDSLATPAFQPEGLGLHPSGTEFYVTGEDDEYYRYSLGWHREGNSAGTFTGISSAPTNVATLTINKGQYMRVGNVVTYSTRFVLAQTASGATTFKLSLPVVSNFAAEEDAAGICNGVGSSSVYGNVTADAATDTLLIRLAASVTTSQTWCLQVTYQVIP